MGQPPTGHFVNENLRIAQTCSKMACSACFPFDKAQNRIISRRKFSCTIEIQRQHRKNYSKTNTPGNPKQMGQPATWHFVNENLRITETCPRMACSVLSILIELKQRRISCRKLSDSIEKMIQNRCSKEWTNSLVEDFSATLVLAFSAAASRCRQAAGPRNQAVSQSPPQQSKVEIRAQSSQPTAVPRRSALILASRSNHHQLRHKRVQPSRIVVCGPDFYVTSPYF